MEAFIVLFGMCITFVPIICFVRYLMSSIKETTKFDAHVKLVKDKNGSMGIAVAYITKIIQACMISSLGIYMSTDFDYGVFGEIFVISLILFIILFYIDNYNEK